eukprot:g2036.t1
MLRDTKVEEPTLAAERRFPPKSKHSACMLPRSVLASPELSPWGARKASLRHITTPLAPGLATRKASAPVLVGSAARAAADHARARPQLALPLSAGSSWRKASLQTPVLGLPGRGGVGGSGRRRSELVRDLRGFNTQLAAMMHQGSAVPAAMAATAAPGVPTVVSGTEAAAAIAAHAKLRKKKKVARTRHKIRRKLREPWGDIKRKHRKTKQVKGRVIDGRHEQFALAFAMAHGIHFSVQLADAQASGNGDTHALFDFSAALEPRSADTLSDLAEVDRFPTDAAAGPGSHFAAADSSDSSADAVAELDAAVSTFAAELAAADGDEQTRASWGAGAATRRLSLEQPRGIGHDTSLRKLCRAVSATVPPLTDVGDHLASLYDQRKRGPRLLRAVRRLLLRRSVARPAQAGGVARSVRAGSSGASSGSDSEGESEGRRSRSRVRGRMLAVSAGARGWGYRSHNRIRHAALQFLRHPQLGPRARLAPRAFDAIVRKRFGRDVWRQAECQAGVAEGAGTAHGFAFVDHAPQAFARIRANFGVTHADYVHSLCSELSFIEFISNSKSGQYFFFSYDGAYMVKTQTPSEEAFLRRILPLYYAHVMAHPGTLLTRFYGMHRVKMPHLGRTVRFVVMSSVFDTEVRIDHTYDLKGSTHKRWTGDGDSGPLKDSNWLQDGAKLRLGALQGAVLMKQLRADVSLLQALDIMDYSLLVGLHTPGQGSGRGGSGSGEGSGSGSGLGVGVGSPGSPRATPARQLPATPPLPTAAAASHSAIDSLASVAEKLDAEEDGDEGEGAGE